MKSITVPGCILLMAMGSLSTVCQAQNLVTNGSFELPSMNLSGDSSDNSLSSWIGNATRSRTFGAYYVPSSAFNVSPPALDGKQIAYVNDATSIAQDTGVSLGANQLYTFTAYIGKNNSSANALGQILLYSGGVISQGSVTGGTLLGSSSPGLTTGQYSIATVSYLANASSPSGSIIVELKSLSQDQVNFESVSLVRSSAVPEGGLVSLVFGCLVTGSFFFKDGLKRKRKI